MIKPLMLGRIPSFDQRSREFGVRKLMSGAPPPRSQEWYCSAQLNQGHLSACVGFSWCHFLACMPHPVTGMTNEKAISIYRHAQTIDEWQGPPPPAEGTSVRAGVRTIQQKYPGLISAYHWCFGIDDLIMTLGYIAPVVLGIPWLSGMFDVDDKSMIHATGTVTGGHAILAKGVNIEDRLVRLQNSWGVEWSPQLAGDCFISFDDLERLLKDDGEACVATGKRMGSI